MSKNDELDHRRAKAFAWRFVRPGETIVLPDEEPNAQPDADLDADTDPGLAKLPEQAAGSDSSSVAANSNADALQDISPIRRERFVRDAQEACALLAVEIERTWLLPEAEQAEAIEPLLRRAEALGLGLCAMRPYPCQGIRLLRLALRCQKELPDEVWKAACASAAWLDYHHPELIELLVEVARAGARSLVAGLMLAIADDGWNAVGRISGAVSRIAQVIDEGPSYTARCIAVTWLSRTGGRAAVPALRRALRKPHFVLREHALDVLNQHFPEMLSAEDVVFLVNDALIHAPPDYLRSEEVQRASFYFPQTLESAIVRLRPKGAIEPLVCMVEEYYTPRWPMGPGLNAAWALCVLAAAFPDEAVPHIDKRLRHVSWDRREMATEAAGRLPDALAKPRLITAAADSVPEIAERAQAIWLERYASLCPLEPMAGVETAVLKGPPSELMRSRLDVLRRGPLAARAAMVEVLLGEAPDPEALALLLFAGMDSSLWERKPRAGLPESRESFGRALVERFGAAAVEGLLLLEDRYPEGRWGWLSALADLLRNGIIPEAAYPALAAAAVRRIPGTEERPESDAIAILAHIGPPPALADYLWGVARNPAETGYIRNIAIRALARLPADEAGLDSAVQAEMETALAAQDLPRFALAIAVGFGRKLPAAITLAERTLAELGPGRPEQPRVLTALADCADALAAIGRLPDTWLLDMLGRPGTYLCAVAARRAYPRKLLQPEVEALSALLAGPDPACAAEAACALLTNNLIGPEHAGLTAIAARAPLALRAELLFRMWARGAAVGDVWPLIEPLLVSADPEVTEPIRHLGHEFEKAGQNERLRVLLPQVVDAELRLDIEDLLARDEEAYWKDEE